MTLRELKSIRILRKRICELDEQIEDLKSVMERATPTLSPAPCKCGNRDSRAAQIVRKIELEAELREKDCLLNAIIDRVEIWLNILPEQQAKVIRARYIEGMSWALASIATGYKRDHCRKIHDNAIKKIC
jgi:DNA-directed RNA polymerase specialized sigma24 family protein